MFFPVHPIWDTTILPNMRTRINKAISHLGLKIAGGGCDGVFYFVDIASNKVLEANSVYVSAMTHLPVSRWVAEAESAHRQDRQNQKPLQDLVPVIKLSARIY